MKYGKYGKYIDAKDADGMKSMAAFLFAIDYCDKFGHEPAEVEVDEFVNKTFEMFCEEQGIKWMKGEEGAWEGRGG